MIASWIYQKTQGISRHKFSELKKSSLPIVSHPVWICIDVVLCDLQYRSVISLTFVVYSKKIAVKVQSLKPHPLAKWSSCDHNAQSFRREYTR